MASAGLLAALGGAAKYGLHQQERKADMADEEKKLRLRMKLEQELQASKMEYAKLNPEFRQFMTDETTGDLTGIDQFGRSKLIREGSPEFRARAKQDRDLSVQAKEAEIGLRKAQAASEPIKAQSMADYREGRVTNETARTEAYVNDKNNPKPKKSTRIEPTDASLRADVIRDMKVLHPDWFAGGMTPSEGDSDYPEFKATLDSEIAARRAARGTGPAPNAAPSTDIGATDPFSEF